MTYFTEDFELESRKIEFGVETENFDLNDETLELNEGVLVEKTNVDVLPLLDTTMSMGNCKTSSI